jgi:peptidoglycan/LPS O-acetylase OafA/YrhL
VLQRADRALLPDALKAVAAQVIVWHHLSLYGPLASAWALEWPLVHEAVFQHGRRAVQVFLVVGGYLAGLSLLRSWPTLPSLPGRWWRRYLRLALPFAVVLVVAVWANEAARPWLDEHAVGRAHGLGSFVAHLALLHGVLGIESITAGAWYVAIDWQLHAVLMLMAALVLRAMRWWHGEAPPMQQVQVLAAAVAVGVVASLWIWSRDGRLDAVAPYFWGAYGAGALIALATALPPRQAAGWMLAVLALLVARWLWAPRPQVLVAALTVGLLAVATWTRSARTRAAGRAWWCSFASAAAAALRAGGSLSYALFLVHFPVLIAVNACWVAGLPFASKQPADNVGLSTNELALVVAWALSLVAAWALHHGVERPLARRLQL